MTDKKQSFRPGVPRVCGGDPDGTNGTDGSGACSPCMRG